MNKTIYQDYKYCMQDTSSLYIGAKYTLDEILEEDDISFKYRLLVERYVLPEADRTDTLETHLYYLDPKSFLVKIYKQIKGRVKINIIEEKKSLFGSVKQEYVTKLLTVEQLAAIPVEEKKSKGVVIQELVMSKLGLMAF